MAAVGAAFLLMSAMSGHSGGASGASVMENRCVEVDAVRAALPIIVPTGQAGDHLKANEAESFVAAFNRLPPETGIEANEVLAFGIGRVPAVFLIFFRRGCALEGQGRLSPDTYLELRARSRGLSL
jgi:hypothetical protein